MNEIFSSAGQDRIPICIDTKNSFQLYNRFLSIWRAPRASYFANQPRWIKDRAQVSMEPFFNPRFQTWFFDLSIICLIVPCIFIETYKKKLRFVLLNRKFNRSCWTNITIKFIECNVNNIANIYDANCTVCDLIFHNVNIKKFDSW